MVSLKAVEQSNADFKANASGQVTFFVGATSGIAMNTLLQYARCANAPKVYLVGRSDAQLSPVVKELEKINPQGSYKAIKAEISLLRNVDAACDEFKKHEKKLDLLFICLGYLKVTRVDNADGLEDTMSLRYYARARFIHNFLPHLTAVPSARIVSVQGAGKEGPLIEPDFELRDNFSFVNAATQASTLNTLALSHIASQHPTISCVHAFPGMVVTKVYNTLVAEWYIPLRWMFIWGVFPLMKMVTAGLEEVGARQLFHATSARYPPKEVMKKGSKGVELPNGVEVAKGEDWELGSGCYLLGPQGETVGDRKLLEEFRKRDAGSKVWEHTLEVFERVLRK